MGPAHSECPSHYCYGWEQNITQGDRVGLASMIYRPPSGWASHQTASIKCCTQKQSRAFIHSGKANQEVCCGSDIGKITSLKAIVNMPVTDPVVNLLVTVAAKSASTQNFSRPIWRWPLTFEPENWKSITRVMENTSTKLAVSDSFCYWLTSSRDRDSWTVIKHLCVTQPSKGSVS